MTPYQFLAELAACFLVMFGLPFLVLLYGVAFL